MKSNFVWGVILVAAVVFPCGSGHAVPYSFPCITNSSAVNAAIGEAQLWLDVTDAGTTERGASRVLFTFHNNGPAASSIQGVSFDGGHLLGIASIIGSSGVFFSQGATPSGLPGETGVCFEASTGFLAEADSPHRTANGVSPDEWLGICSSLINGASFETVIADLISGDPLRVSIHVQGFANGESESFVNGPTPPAPVPEPATMLLIGAGMIGLADFRKRFWK